MTTPNADNNVEKLYHGNAASRSAKSHSHHRKQIDSLLKN